MAGQVKIRLQGLPEDCEKTALALKTLMNVLEESADYQNRGNSKFVRRYLTVIPEPPASNDEPV